MANSISSTARGIGARGISQSPPTPGDSYGQMAPLFQQYNEWQFGRPYNAALPRDPKQFLSGAFGPLDPIVPVGIDEMGPDGRPMPRRQQYNVGWNMPTGTPGTEGLKLATFATLRSFADLYSVVRSVIDLCVGEIVGTEWDVVPTKTAELAMHGNSKAQDDFAKRREVAMKFWSKPDPNYSTWQTWMTALLEDFFVLDAMSLYPHPTPLRGHGPFGSSFASLDVIDGSTIRPLLDVRGGTPTGPNVAYQQYVWGVPRVDLSVPLIQDDDGITAVQVDEFRGDQIMYLPHKVRDWTPYGFSNLERALIPAATGLRRQIYALQFYTEGSIPAVYVTPGDSISTPHQIAQLQRALNNIAGDQAFKHQVIVLPPGSKTDPQKTISLADQFDQVLAAEVTMAFQKTPMDIGITPRVSAVQSPSETKEFSQLNSENAQKRGVKPRLEFLKSAIFDFTMQKLWGQSDMEWFWPGMETPEAEETKVTIWTGLTKAGIASIDEARPEFGLQPLGLPETQVPMVLTASGPVPLTSQVVVGSPQAQQLLAEGTIDPSDAEARQTEVRATTAHAEGGAASETRYGGKPTPAHRAAAAAQSARPAAANPAGQSSARPAAATAQATGQAKPVTTKAALAELDALRRAVRKGRTVDDWLPKA